jgi:hypothetical protein
MSAPEPFTGFQAKGTLAAIKGKRTLAELAQRIEVHLNRITSRKAGAVECMASPLNLKVMFDRTRALPLSRQAALLTLCRSTTYYRAGPVSAADLAITRRIDERGWIILSREVGCRAACCVAGVAI